MMTVGRPAMSTVSGWPPPLASRTRAAYLIFLNDSNMRDPRAARVRHDLAREQLHALAGQLVRDADLAAGQDDADAELLLVLLQLLADRGRAADDGVDALLDIVPGLLRVEEVL